MHGPAMTINQEHRGAGIQRGQRLMAAGGLLAALAASSCCVLPLVLFSLGVSGAWIGNFTQLAPYQHCFIVATIAFLGIGYWLVYRSSKLACTDGGACAHPLPNRFVHFLQGEDRRCDL
jgi:mercuric ion transport protein